MHDLGAKKITEYMGIKDTLHDWGCTPEYERYSSSQQLYVPTLTKSLLITSRGSSFN